MVRNHDQCTSKSPSCSLIFRSIGHRRVKYYSVAIPLHHFYKEQISYPGHSRFLPWKCWDPLPELQTEIIELTLIAAFFSFPVTLKYVSSFLTLHLQLLLGLRGVGWSWSVWVIDNKQQKEGRTSLFSLWEIKSRLIKASRNNRIVLLEVRIVFFFYIIPTLCYLISDQLVLCLLADIILSLEILL